MAVIRAMLLAASQNRWLREHASRYAFVKRSVSRFMPGEDLDDAVAAARELRKKNIQTVLTHLGENVFDAREAEQVTAHYLQVLEKLHSGNLETEISVKLTQLGLDLSPEICEQNLRRLFATEDSTKTLWIDMEASGYVDATLNLYRKLLGEFPNAGICLQAYLHRTAKDVESLLALNPSIRLVKGAYAESPSVAIHGKRAIDANYFALAQNLLRAQITGAVRRVAFATHDPVLIRNITDFAAAEGISRSEVEVQMLYGIQRTEQERLASGGWRSGVLIAYGNYWYPWFVRRLAERPANLWLLLRNLAGNG
jgi:proline dehydrogenase